MWQYWSHLKYTIRHKYFVATECFKKGLFIRGLMHDLSKFTPSEFAGYANFFFDSNGARKADTDLNSDEIKKAFDRAWVHHQKVNDHHWQYWDAYLFLKVPMPKECADEMICDWIGAARANNQNEPDIPLPWYKENHLKLKLNNNTRKYIEEQIGFTGDEA